MRYCELTSDKIIKNIIVSDSDFAMENNLYPAYSEAEIGGAYDPPYSPPSHTTEDFILAQITYTAMMTDTMIGGK